MTHYIDKDAVVAEIESLKSAAETMLTGKTDLPYWKAQKHLCERFLSFIKTLEVREVNLEKEIELVKGDYEQVDVAWNNDFDFIARHFFELGLLSTITEEDCKLIWTIGDELPYMSEEEFYKELLKRYKEETKPKFSIGDIIRFGNTGEGYIRITQICDDCYHTDSALQPIISFSNQDKWELVEEPKAPKVLEDMLNAKTPAESLGISQEEYDKIVDECIFGEEESVSKIWHDASEKPVSENLEEVAKLYTLDDSIKPWRNLTKEAFKAGAKWQKLQDMGITNKAQDVVTNVLSSADNLLDAYATEVAFMMLPATLKESYHQTNRNRISDAVRLGAKWQKEQLMAKAVDGVVHHFEKCKVASVHYNDPTGVPMAYFTFPEGLSTGDKVKIIVIKED